jgi:hypothetical protein
MKGIWKLCFSHFAIAFGLIFLLGVLTPVQAQDSLGPPFLLDRQQLTLDVPREALRRQFELLSAMPSVEVAYAPTGSIKNLRGNTGLFLDEKTRRLQGGESAKAIHEALADLLLSSGEEGLTIEFNRSKGTGARIIHMIQEIRGIPVLHGGLVLEVNETTGLIESLGGRYLPDRGLPVHPKFSAADASRIASRLASEQSMAAGGSVTAASNPTLAYFGGFPPMGPPHLLWVVNLSLHDAQDTSIVRSVWIDAIDGLFVGSEPLTSAALSSTVYTANGSSPDPQLFPSGLTLLSPAQVQADSVALNAYNNAGVAYGA